MDTHMPPDVNRKNELLRRALREGRVSAGSLAHQKVADLFDANPSDAERLVNLLHPSETAAANNAQGAIEMAQQQTASASAAYDSGWLTQHERARASHRSHSHHLND